jgi:hypothetical protein
MAKQAAGAVDLRTWEGCVAEVREAWQLAEKAESDLISCIWRLGRAAIAALEIEAPDGEKGITKRLQALADEAGVAFKTLERARSVVAAFGTDIPPVGGMSYGAYRWLAPRFREQGSEAALTFLDDLPDDPPAPWKAWGLEAIQKHYAETAVGVEPVRGQSAQERAAKMLKGVQARIEKLHGLAERQRRSIVGQLGRMIEELEAAPAAAKPHIEDDLKSQVGAAKKRSTATRSRTRSGGEQAKRPQAERKTRSKSAAG